MIRVKTIFSSYSGRIERCFRIRPFFRMIRCVIRLCCLIGVVCIQVRCDGFIIIHLPDIGKCFYRLIRDGLDPVDGRECDELLRPDLFEEPPGRADGREGDGLPGFGLSGRVMVPGSDRLPEDGLFFFSLYRLDPESRFNDECPDSRLLRSRDDHHGFFPVLPDRPGDRLFRVLPENVSLLSESGRDSEGRILSVRMRLSGALR